MEQRATGTIVAPRDGCLRCRRPVGACWCALVPRLETRTRVVILQHPRERKVAIGTARMAHLALAGSQLHEGVSFAGRAELEALARDPSAAVLFPGGEETLDPPPAILFVVDGTWPQARKLIRENPILAGMRRVGLRPSRPGAYRIRREPSAECLATVEALAAVLARLEDDPRRFADMLRAFHFMVEQQLEHARSRAAPRRRAHRSPARRGGPELAALRAGAGDVVLIHAEANAHGAREGSGVLAELVHLVAVRPIGGQRFEALVAPRRPLGARTAFHLGVDGAALLGGERPASALARFRDFLGPAGRPCGWGNFAPGLLARESLTLPAFTDLRVLYTRLHPTLARGLDRAADALGAPAPPGSRGRAGRMLGCLETVFSALIAPAA